jgi:hypothetical protein
VNWELPEWDGGVLVGLWVPYRLDQKMHEPGDRVAISAVERWHSAELALAALAGAWPARSVGFGLEANDGVNHFWPWNEWPFRVAPEFVVGWWDRVEE